MAGKRRFLYLIPPGVTTIRSIRLHLPMLFFLVFLICIGFVGYIIPPDFFTISASERNLKQNLEQQNKKLTERIITTRKDLGLLSSQIEKLQAQQISVHALTGISTGDEKTSRVRKGSIAPYSNLDKLLTIITDKEAFFSSFSKVIEQNPALFYSIPLCYPVIGQNRTIVNSFGHTTDPFTGKDKWHNAIDFAAEPGTPVIATASGVVVNVTNDALWGRKIALRHGFDFATVYAHLGTINVSSGKRVNRGDNIATIGISGMTTGPHLHYEVIYKGEKINPETFIFPTTGLLHSSDLTQNTQPSASMF